MWFVGKKELVKSLKEISYNVPQQRWECDILAYYNLCISLTIPLDDLNDRLETVQISTYAKQDPRLRLQCSSSIKRKLTTTRQFITKPIFRSLCYRVQFLPSPQASSSSFSEGGLSESSLPESDSFVPIPAPLLPNDHITDVASVRLTPPSLMIGPT